MVNILWIGDSPQDVRRFRCALTRALQYFRLDIVQNLALAPKQSQQTRYDSAVLNVSVADLLEGSEQLELPTLLKSVSTVIIVADRYDEPLASSLIRHGVEDYLLREQIGSALVRSIRTAIERHRLKEELVGLVEKLNAGNERLRKIIDSNADGMIVVNQDGIVQLINPAAERLLGLSREEMVGQLLRLPLACGDSTELEIPWMQGAATTTVQLRVVEIQWDGEPALLGSLRDVTELKKAERLHLEKQAVEAASQAKSEFLARMSHELRTPLNSIIGFTSLLLKRAHPDGWNERDRRFLSMVLKNGRHLLELINDILDIARIEAGRVHLCLSQVCLRSLISSVVAGVDVLKDGEVELLTEFPEHLAPLETDEAKMRQILVNLLDNALKFTERGRVTIGVEADELGTPRSIRVEDTGIGIPPDQLEAIFKPFHQVDGTARRRFQGTGLGLSICLSLCRQLGFELQVESRPDRGSAFTVLIPMPKQELVEDSMSSSARSFALQTEWRSEYSGPLEAGKES